MGGSSLHSPYRVYDKRHLDTISIHQSLLDRLKQNGDKQNKMISFARFARGCCKIYMVSISSFYKSSAGGEGKIVCLMVHTPASALVHKGCL